MYLSTQRFPVFTRFYLFRFFSSKARVLKNPYINQLWINCVHHQNLTTTPCLVAAMQAYPCYLSRSHRPTDHRNMADLDETHQRKKEEHIQGVDLRCWETCQDFKGWSFFEKHGNSNVDVFLLNLRCSLERIDLRRFSGHMLCDACCMHLLDDNEKCKKVMMVDGFPVCFSCYPKWQNVINQQSVQNQKTQNLR